ncbi:NnrS family protein [Consotaella aegiceratis]|uniref:NnrS family protein n=1 Tax=Consotaella aegiceratis TaxID=3097961 RepID=UPI002F41122A
MRPLDHDTSPALAATRARTEAGWLFAASFRPFFLGASLLAATAVPVWVAVFLGGVAEVAGLAAPAWHAHEMVFGFLPAAIAGYLLSATPNWSGRLPASGSSLAGLFGLWLAGRLVPLVAPFGLGAAADAAFPAAMTLVLLREARIKMQGQTRHGLTLFPLLAVAAVGHRWFAADYRDYEWAATAARLGIATGALLIAAVGGRLVPSFTRNVLARAEAASVPEPYGRYDIAVLIVSSLGLLSWVAAPQHPATAILMTAATLANAIRLWRWRGWLLRQADVLALHAGYLWLVVGLAMAALAAEPLALVPPDAGLHALTAGAIGAMTAAVMARLTVTRGSGRRADAKLALAAILLINIGAFLRVGAPLALDHYMALLIAGTIAWSSGFALLALAQRPFAWRSLLS